MYRRDFLKFAALIVGGCDVESFSVNADAGEIHVEGKNCNGSNGTAELDENDNVLFGDAKIESGKIEIKIGDKIHTFDKSGEISFDVPVGSREIVFTGLDNFTGEITLKSVPKI